MIELALPGNNTIAGVRKPVFDVVFSSGATAAGSLADAAASIAGLTGAEDPWQRSLLSMTTHSALGSVVDTAEMIIAADDAAPTVALGDSGTLSLGYDDEGSSAVMQAQIETVTQGVFGTTRITACNGGAALARLRINQSYEQQSAGDIVSDLSDQAGVSTGTVESGIDYPFYVIDDRTDALRQIMHIARQCDFIHFFNPQGELYFGPLSMGQAVQTFTYAGDILQLQWRQSQPVVGKLKTVGEGAVGSDGKEAWHWLLKDPAALSSELGSSGPARLISEPALRSSEAAQSAVQGAKLRADMLPVSGRMVVPGAANVAVGNTIAISDTPQAVLNGDFFVTAVSHVYDKQTGFTSRIDFTQIQDSGGLGGLF